MDRPWAIWDQADWPRSNAARATPFDDSWLADRARLGGWLDGICAGQPQIPGCPADQPGPKTAASTKLPEK
jgi:hypothetical protein